MSSGYYEFYCPVKIVSGPTALDGLPHELKETGATRPLVVTDQGVKAAGLMDLVEAAFHGSDLEIAAVYDATPPDSSLAVVQEIAGLYRAQNCDSLVAVGGGSAIDTAKGVNILVSLGGDDLAAYAGAERLTEPLRPLIVIPTTAGTGSEVTLLAVVADTGRDLKMLFTSPHLLPRAAILDPRLTLTLPPRLTAATGMDALTHAIEAYICLQKNPMSDAYAVAAITAIAANLREVVADGKDAGRRLALAGAATMAGIAFSNSMVGMIHSLGHATGAVAHVPHGVAMSIFLPFGLEYNLAKVGGHIGELLLPLAGAEVFAATPPEDRPQRTIKEIRGLQRDLHQLSGLPYTLKEAGVAWTQLEEIAAKTLDDGALAYNPAEVSLDEALRVLKRAYE